MRAATWVAVVLAIALVGWALRSGLSIGTPAAPSGGVQVRTWYPEPEVILAHGDEIQLTARQYRQVQVADREWQLKRAAFDAQFRSYDSSATQALRDLAAGKPRSGRYGQLLHDFDQARDAAWKGCTDHLDPQQVLRIDAIRQGLSNQKK